MSRQFTWGIRVGRQRWEATGKVWGLLLWCFGRFWCWVCLVFFGRVVCGVFSIFKIQLWGFLNIQNPTVLDFKENSYMASFFLTFSIFLHSSKEFPWTKPKKQTQCSVGKFYQKHGIRMLRIGIGYNRIIMLKKWRGSNWGLLGYLSSNYSISWKGSKGTIQALLSLHENNLQRWWCQIVFYSGMRCKRRQQCGMWDITGR